MEISLVVAELDPVGQFVGSAVAEPMLQGGILLSVLGYMAYLQPLIALVVLAVLSPQFVFVPLMQRAINKRATARIVFCAGSASPLLKTLRPLAIASSDNGLIRRVVNGRTQVGTVVAFISGLAEINDPWGDLVTWFRDMRVVNAKYRLIFDAVENLEQSAP